MRNHVAKFIIILVGTLVIGCGGGGGSSPSPAPSPTPVDPTALPGTYTASSVTVNLTNCTSATNNGDFVFDTGSFVVPSFTGSDFTATVTLTKNDAGNVLETVLTVTGTIDSSGKLTGSFTSTFSVNGGASTTGVGTFTGQFNGTSITVSSTGTDTSGDTCKSTANITFTNGGSTTGGTNPPSGNGVQITGSDTGTIGTSAQFTSVTFAGNTYFWNSIITSPYKITNLYVYLDDVTKAPASITFGVIYANQDNYTYTLTCAQGTTTSGDCSGVTIDTSAQTASFNNVFLFVAPGVSQNLASSGVTISGTLPTQ